MLMLQGHPVPSRGRFPRRFGDLVRGWRTPQHRDGFAQVLSSGIASAHGTLLGILIARRGGSSLRRGGNWGRVNYPPC